MSDPKRTRSKRSRNKYSRLVCLGCHERRIKCELPSGVEIPNPGELRTIDTPCYRCKRLGVPCVIRRTVLGRPGSRNHPTNTADIPSAGTSDVDSRIIIELPLRSKTHPHPGTVLNEPLLVNHAAIVPELSWQSSSHLPLSQKDAPSQYGDTLLIHTPQSTETLFIIRALDTLRCENVEQEWFRYLPAHVGHTPALDLSIKAIIVACAYARGVPKLTSTDCYRALALALDAVQMNMRYAHEKPDDDMLASTALLLPFEGVMKRNGIPTRLHIDGLAAILTARPSTYPVTPFAREILDFHACESTIMACVQGIPSPFETIPPAYFAAPDSIPSNSVNDDRSRLKALGNELFIRIPRLVNLTRSLRLALCPPTHLLSEAFQLLQSLLALQDPQAEHRLFSRTTTLHPTKTLDPASSPLLRQSLHFSSLQDFEALVAYWQNRLSLLKLRHRLYDLPSVSGNTSVSTNSTDTSTLSLFRPNFGPQTTEVTQYVHNLIMCLDYAATLPLRKHDRLILHAVLVVWGISKDFPESFFGLDGDGKSGRGALEDLLLRRVNRSLGAKPPLHAGDLDLAAEMFAGGEVKGRFAELHQF